MDKLFFAVYGVLICLGIIFITALQYTGLNQNEMITVCMVEAGILSITSIGVIDKLFLENDRVRRKLLFQYKTVCCCMAGIVGDDKCYDIVFDSWIFELSLESWIITGRAVYFNSISSIKHNCIRDFINGN